ncbi:hypothetical protein DRW03_25755 [Corallococcus sp. H22C18031201]|nr:hypothetical protein DRW03_25755 [Corallococcus sp. H22C18031201]
MDPRDVTVEEARQWARGDDLASRCRLDVARVLSRRRASSTAVLQPLEEQPSSMMSTAQRASSSSRT